MSKYSLIGIDGNAFAVLGYVIKCMKKEGKSGEEIETYRKEAMSYSYENLLLLCVSQDMINELNKE